MCKQNILTKTISMLSIVVLTHSIANANDDGTERLKVTMTSIKEPVFSSACVDGADWCPEYPDAINLDRNKVITALKHELLCADNESLDSHDHWDSAEHLLDAGGADQVSAAISYAVLRDTGLNIHEIKLALEKLADLDTSTSMQAFEEIYEHSEQLITRQFRHANIPNVSPAERESLIQNQAADLRRMVVLALRDNQRVHANSLLERALDDTELSVTVAAGRELLKHPKSSGGNKVNQRCAFSRDKQAQRFCQLLK